MSRSPEPPLPDPISGSGLLAKVYPPVQWAVPMLIPEGFTVLAGPPKVGKSWLLMHLAAAVAGGRPVWQWQDPEPGPVLYLALEDPARRLQKRLARIRSAWDKCPVNDLQFWPAGSWGRGDTALAMLERAVTKYRPRLVFVDTMSMVRGRGGNQNRYDEDYSFVGGFKGIADAHHTAVVGVFHTSKQARIDPLEEVSGTLGIAGAADTICVVRRPRQDSDSTFFVTSRETDADAEYAYSADLKTGRFTHLGQAAEVKTTTERQSILTILGKHPDGIKPRDVADLLGKSGDATRQLLCRMAAAGEATNLGGKYTLPESET